MKTKISEIARVLSIVAKMNQPVFKEFGLPRILLMMMGGNLIDLAAMLWICKVWDVNFYTLGRTIHGKRLRKVIGTFEKMAKETNDPDAKELFKIMAKSYRLSIDPKIGGVVDHIKKGIELGKSI